MARREWRKARKSLLKYDVKGQECADANETFRAGGLIILSGNGKIDVNNTFEERLHLLEAEALPAVRATLFGENKNRRFRD